MTNKFSIILDILTEAFNHSVSEEDYNNIVESLRYYTRSPCFSHIEEKELAIRGWPLTYHPCDHMETIRFAMSFGVKDNTHIKDLLLKLHSLQKAIKIE